MMPGGRVLIVPDKFKGTLTAPAVAEAMARGWKRERPGDFLEVLPMSDGGDGFGEVMGRLVGARAVTVSTVDAARRPRRARWWWEPESKTAVIESAQVIGLALLPEGGFHPFDLDTFGLGAVFEAAAGRGARHCIVGIGGSATNDGGFGVARALGWAFFDRAGRPIEEWTALTRLARIEPPSGRKRFARVTVAVDVRNPLVGARGATRVYGPQKGLKETDFPVAEKALRRLADVVRDRFGKDFRREPGAGAAGGLGFGLMSFMGGRPRPGFDLFARHADLRRCVRSVDLVITGEGAIDHSSLMGKGVGEVADLCRRLEVPCIALAGIITARESACRLFHQTHALTDIAAPGEARSNAAFWVERLAGQIARGIEDVESLSVGLTDGNPVA